MLGKDSLLGKNSLLRKSFRLTSWVEPRAEETSSEGFEPPLVALETIVLTIDTMSFNKSMDFILKRIKNESEWASEVANLGL